MCLSDLSQLLLETGSSLYADDTCIFYKDKEAQKYENVLNKKLLFQWEWFIANKLSIYSGQNKTKSILFSKEKGVKENNISFAGYCIKQPDIIEYLGSQHDSEKLRFQKS